MAQKPKYSIEEMIEAFERLGSKRAAAEELGVSRSTLRRHLKLADVAVESPNDPAQPILVRPHYRVQQRLVDPHASCYVLAIGDLHDSPGIPDKSRFEALGRVAAESQVDQIIQIGDFTSLDSMSFHDDNGTVKGKAKPTFKEDMLSMKAALEAFDRGLAGYQCPKHITLGNHEERLFRWVNQHPEVVDLVEEFLYQPLKDYGWTTSPYGEFYFIGDVGFTHVPMNGMGRPYGGMNSETSIARDALHDIVYGHTHKRVDKTFPKMGNKKITVLNLGCALPNGHVENYAKHSLTGWSYGAYLIDISCGRISSQSWISMETLE